MSDEIESAKSQRTSAKRKFTGKLKEFLRAVDEDKGLEIVDRTYAELKESWKNAESKHDMYVALIEERTASTKRLGLRSCKGALVTQWKRR
jgi:hypothetical protein